LPEQSIKFSPSNLGAEHGVVFKIAPNFADYRCVCKGHTVLQVCCDTRLSEVAGSDNGHLFVSDVDLRVQAWQMHQFKLGQG
jgi:hypothetical protein